MHTTKHTELCKHQKYHLSSHQQAACCSAVKQRAATSDYTSAESCTLADLQCQICLGTLRDCVTVEPCGHNWCATCLSHHFACRLQVSCSALLHSTQHSAHFTPYSVQHCVPALYGYSLLVGSQGPLIDLANHICCTCMSTALNHSCTVSADSCCILLRSLRMNILTAVFRLEVCSMLD